MSKFGKAVDKEVRYTGLNMFKSFLGGMAFGALLMGLLLLPSTLKASEYDEGRYCLAQNIYFESANQSFAGQIAVSHVVINRVEDLQFPETICGVVYQAKMKENWKGNMVPIRNQCQFSWFCDGKSDEPKDNDAWERAKLIAYQISVHRQFRGITEGATHYHAFYVDPSWAQRYQQIGTIGLHRFYRAE